MNSTDLGNSYMQDHRIWFVFCDWLISLSTMLSRLIYVVTCIKILFFFPSTFVKAYFCWTVYTYLLFFSLSVVSKSMTPWTAAHWVSPVLHHLLKFAQAHVHRADDAIQPSHPLLSPSPPAFCCSWHHGLF